MGVSCVVGVDFIHRTTAPAQATVLEAVGAAAPCWRGWREAGFLGSVGLMEIIKTIASFVLIDFLFVASLTIILRAFIHTRSAT